MRRVSGWTLYLVVAGLLAVAYFLLPSTPLTKLFLYNGLGLSAVVAVIAGVRRHRPQRPLPWYLFAAGQASFLTADVIYYVLADVMHIEAFPSLADPFYQAMYPLVILGLVLLTRHILPGRDLPSLLDATIIAICGFVLLWVFIMDGYATDSALGGLGKFILLAQPTFDVLLLAVAVRLAAVVRTAVPAMGMLAVGVSGLLIADVSYGLAQLTSGYQTGGFIDLAWMSFYASFGVAALHPSMATLHAVPAAVGVRLTRKRLILLSLATLTVPLVDVLFGELGLVDQVVTTGAAMALFLLVLARVAGLVRSVEDSQEQLRYEASHDALTGLANRVLFANSVERAMALQPDSSSLIAVLFIDLDDFKTVNDSQGHAAGDALLKIVAERLASCLRPTDLAARLGGDEFAVLLRNVSATQDAAEIAERIVTALSHPAMIGDREVLVGASVGIGVQPRQGEGLAQPDVEDLLRGADVAMYLAKSKGKGRYEFFQQAMYDEMVERLELKADLQKALELDELHLVYQPIVDLSGGVTSVEALLRWQHPRLGLVVPDRLIPLAEETGLIVPIGRWVLQRACAHAASWNLDRADEPAVGVSVNLSVRQLHDARLVDHVAAVLSVTSLAPHLLTLEITESVLMMDGEIGRSQLEALKTLGVKVAIDDFGTGYSSLSYLQRFPVDIIKIDRSFIMGLSEPGETRSSALIRSVVDLASALSLTTIAEGIEDDLQLAALEALNCQAGQGYYFSRPVDEDTIAGLLHTADPERTQRAHARTAARTAGAVYVVEAHRGPAALDRVGADLDELHAALSVPINARRAWLDTWARTHETYEPWVIVVRRRGRSGIDGAALLAAMADDAGLVVVGMGHGCSGVTALPARVGAEQALADAITETLTSLSQPWSLHLEQIAAGDPVAAAVAGALAGARLAPDRRIPRVSLTTGDDVRAYLSRNTHRSLKKAHNRLQRDGHDVAFAFHRDPGAVASLLGDIERVHRQRDHDLRRVSDLDDPAELDFWRRVILQHTMRGEVEIATLLIDGGLAAYVVSLLDGSSYRVYDGRFDSAFAHLAPGRLLESAALERALGDSRYTELDWWSGLSSDKLLTENVSFSREWLSASSHPPVPTTAAASVTAGIVAEDG